MVRPDRAVLSIDLGEDKQVAALMDHDCRVLGRRVAKAKAHELVDCCPGRVSSADGIASPVSWSRASQPGIGGVW
jgi:hypothetical protein